MLKPPSNHSDSDESRDDKPPRIPLQSAKRPSSNPIKLKEEAPTEVYHFDMKLKPEMVPTWDGNEDTLARLVEKVGQIADTSPKLGTILSLPRIANRWSRMGEH
jgi:hypothetical protein